MPRANMVLSMVGTIAPSGARAARRQDAGRRMRDVADRLDRLRDARAQEGLTASGLLIARETDAVDTPARAATARMLVSM